SGIGCVGGIAISNKVDKVDAVIRARGFAEAAGQIGLLHEVAEMPFEAADRLIGVGLLVGRVEAGGMHDWRGLQPVEVCAISVWTAIAQQEHGQAFVKM